MQTIYRDHKTFGITLAHMEWPIGMYNESKIGHKFKLYFQVNAMSEHLSRHHQIRVLYQMK
jgi:hypothetical protein